jgi:hypothetical protein
MKKFKNQNPQNDQDWFNADGWQSADAWENAEGDSWAAAEGEAAPPSRVSAPYIIQLVNACTSAISSVDVGDSYANRAATNFSQNSNITITSTITGVTYIEFLAQSESQPFKIGRTMVISTSAGQLDQTVGVTHRDATGNSATHVITPTIDPYQNQTDRIIDDYEYLFDGFTRLRFNQINASATVTVRMYPTGKFVATQLVAGRPGLPQYAAPHLIKVAPTSIPRPRMIGGK